MASDGIHPAMNPDVMEGRYPMKGFKIYIFILVQLFIASSLFADIYEWTDENGVKHFTNYAPPDNAKLMMKTEPVPYDETDSEWAAADNERTATEEQDRLELARQEFAEREADLERKVAEAERRLAEIDRQAERTDSEAEELSDEAGDAPYIDRSYSRYGYYSGYYTTPYKGRKYYRGTYGGIYYKKPYYKTYHRYRHYKKHNYRHHKRHFFKNKHIPRHHIRSHVKRGYGKHHYRSDSRRHHG